jgi:hypothetical protein
MTVIIFNIVGSCPSVYLVITHKYRFKESCGLRHNINIGNVHFKGNLCSLSLDSKLLKILGSMYLLYRMII